MGTVVRAGSGAGVVVATGGDAEFGRIAVGLGEQQPETEFQVGLRKFSMLLVLVAGVLTGAIFVINVALHKPVIDALLFSLSIAVGISPQLLPAVVSTSLAAGSRQLAQRKVLVERLLHRGPGRHRRAVHRQDRHADRGQPALHALGRAGRHGR